MQKLYNKQISLLKMLATALAIFTFSSCIKVKNHCEEWKVTDENTLNGSCPLDLCSDGSTSNIVFCGDGLKDAKPGNTIIISNDGCCTLTRTFIRMIRAF